MPRWTDEVLYRRRQRQLGEIQVAIRLAVSILKDQPNIPGLAQGVDGLLRAKTSLFQTVIAMEQGE